MVVADGKQSLLEGTAFNFGEEIGEFLVGSQWWCLVCFFRCLRNALRIRAASQPSCPASVTGAFGCILTNRRHGASKTLLRGRRYASIILFTGIFYLTKVLPNGNV